MVDSIVSSISVNSLSMTQNVLPFKLGSALAWAIPLATLTGVFIGNSPNIDFAASPAKLVSIINTVF